MQKKEELQVTKSIANSNEIRDMLDAEPQQNLISLINDKDTLLSHKIPNIVPMDTAFFGESEMLGSENVIIADEIKDYKIVFDATAKQSKRNKELKFSNFVKNKHDQTSQIIKKLLLLDGEKLEEGDFLLNESYANELNLKDRINKILGIDLPQGIIPMKMPYMPLGIGKKGEIRLIYYTMQNQKVILMIDPYHLLATTQYKNYGKVKGYGLCISQLK